MNDNGDVNANSVPAPSKQAFVDAYGTPSLNIDKPNITTHFIIAAVLVDAARAQQLRAQVDAVRAAHFGAGPIKSKKCKDERRIKVLKALAPLDFKFVAVAVDKSRVNRESGLVYGEPLVKFTHRNLLDRLYGAIPDLHVFADPYRDMKFMEGFRRYILRERKRGGQQELFSRARFDFLPSREDPLIQVADFVAGSLAKLYDPKKKTAAAGEIHGLLFNKALYVTDFPRRFRVAAPHPILGGSPHDERVRSHCLDAANRFLAEYVDSEDPELRAQVEALSYLTFAYEADPAAWIPMDKLKEVLESMGIVLGSRQRYTSVIAKLRDAQVIIASSPHGYKIPGGVKDVSAFVERTATVVLPMLDRLATARETLELVTNGELDIVADVRFAELRGILEALAFRGPETDTMRHVG